MIQSITSFISILPAGRLRLCFPSQAKVWISLLFCMNFKRTETTLYCSKMISMTEVNLSKNKMPPCTQLQFFKWNELMFSSYFHFPYSSSSRLQVTNKLIFGDKVFFCLILICSITGKKKTAQTSLLGIIWERLYWQFYCACTNIFSDNI